MDLATEIAKILLEINAIKLNPTEPFTWASGIKSPIYCDNRIALSYPESRSFIKKKLAEKAMLFNNFDVVAGVATAGIPQGVLIADLLNKPFIYIRSKPKGHGRQNLIEGYLKEGQNILVVEDLISTGMSSLKAVEAVRNAGSYVVGVLAIFSYQFPKAAKAFEKANCSFSTLSNYSALLDYAKGEKLISHDELTILKKWNEDPEKWAEKNT